MSTFFFQLSAVQISKQNVTELKIVLVFIFKLDWVVCTLVA